MLSRQIKEPLLYDIKTNKRTRRKKFFCLLLPKQTTLSVFSLKSFNFTFLKWLIRILITCLSEITVQEYGDFLNWSFLGVLMFYSSHLLPLCSSSSLVILVVLALFLELSRLRASLRRFLTRLSSLSSRFSHSRSFFLSSNRFSASFRRFISFCSRKVKYLHQANREKKYISSINQLITDDTERMSNI